MRISASRTIRCLSWARYETILEVPSVTEGCRCSPGSSPRTEGWIEKFKGPGKPCSGGSGTECDEYPFAASMEGGSQGNVSLRSVNGPQNGGAGIQLRWFYKKCKVPKNDPGTKYKVVAARGLETGYVCSR